MSYTWTVGLLHKAVLDHKDKTTCRRLIDPRHIGLDELFSPITMCADEEWRPYFVLRMQVDGNICFQCFQYDWKPLGGDFVLSHLSTPVHQAHGRFMRLLNGSVQLLNDDNEELPCTQDVQKSVLLLLPQVLATIVSSFVPTSKIVLYSCHTPGSEIGDDADDF